MSHRSPVPPASTSAPVLGNGHFNLSSVAESPYIKRPGNQHRSTSLSKLLILEDGPSPDLDPDSLFTKHTISEIKVIQQQLRADANAKQEELRLMVGERYRDLLQASTSIISIAQSSQRVKQALEETREAIISQEEPPLPQKPSKAGGNDTHLYTLQLLSAHIKLLLDAPEHLWRLIERKKYYPAAWLFLLGGVVHRALVQEDDKAEQSWGSSGLDVMEQFPLIQRQWEAVSQFRSQIVHKATLSLREHNMSTEDICATILTLHLLDSRPLMEAFSVMLTQRSKTLYTLLSWSYKPNSASSTTARTNGIPSELASHTSLEFRRQYAKQIREAIHAPLDVISRTVRAARTIFHDNETHASLIRRVLEYIQSDSPSDNSESLPLGLRLTTHNLLTTLPSSTHLLLLPPGLRSYKPYVDLNSSSSSVHHPRFSQKMNEWFHHSSIALHTSINKWLFDLQTIKEVWGVRSSTRSWILSSGLEDSEITLLLNALDDQCRKRAAEIWKSKLSVTLQSFEVELAAAYTTNSLEGPQSASPVQFLFQTPQLPTTSQANQKLGDTSFQKYKASLRRQIAGRTSLLDGLLSILENCARSIQDDLAYIKANSAQAQVLVEQLIEEYRPEANTLCNKIVHSLDTTLDQPEDAHQLEGLVLLGRVAEELSTSSSFISGIGVQSSTVQEFRKKTSAVYDCVADRWRNHVVSYIIMENRLGRQQRKPRDSEPPGPSTDLMRSLLSLSNSIQQLGVSRDITRQRILVQATLRHLIVTFAGDGWERDSAQSLYDLALLWKMAEIQGEEWADVCHLLDEKIEANLQLGESSTDLKQNAMETLVRTQTLLATFLPRPATSATPVIPASPTDKFASLLIFGAPTLEQRFQPAVHLAKPSPRFGLLLVGGS